MQTVRTKRTKTALSKALEESKTESKVDLQYKIDALEVIQRFLRRRVVSKLPSRKYFLEPFVIAQETGLFLRSTVECKKVFENLSLKMKLDFDEMVELLYLSMFQTDKEVWNKDQIFINTTTLDNIPVSAVLRVRKNFNIGPNFITAKGHSLSACFMINRNLEVSHCFQTVTIVDPISVKCKFKVKNALFNLLFHIYYILDTYKYNPLFHYVYNERDMNTLVKMSKVKSKYFKVEYDECVVCYEPCVNQTICNHTLCYRCQTHLTKPECPMCKTSFYQMYDDEDEF